MIQNKKQVVIRFFIPNHLNYVPLQDRYLYIEYLSFILQRSITNICFQRSLIIFLLLMSGFDSPQKDNQNSTHATGHLAVVENLTKEADKDLQQYHRFIQLFRQELNAMKSKILNVNEEIIETTKPLIESLYRSLELGMVNQKQQNGNFQEQLTDLKKEKSIISQMIVTSIKRTEQLHGDVGQY